MFFCLHLNDVVFLIPGALGKDLQEFIAANLPKISDPKKVNFQLGVEEPKLGAAIQDTFNVTCICDQRTDELMRGIRYHFIKFVKIKEEELDKSNLALAHLYSRSEVKFDVNRTDNMVKQAVFLFDQMEKDINLLAMRVKEWYGGHFPELAKIIVDNQTYCKLLLLIKDKNNIASLPEPSSTDNPDDPKNKKYIEMENKIEEITNDSALAKEIMDNARSSMGFEISPIDLNNILRFAQITVNLFEYREKLRKYLTQKMNAVAPNLTALLGVLIASRIVSHAGSLTALSKSAASTIQILGAEKALFRFVEKEKKRERDRKEKERRRRGKRRDK